MTVVGVAFNQSELLVTEGANAEATVCAEVTSGILERNVTVYLETVASTNSDAEQIGKSQKIMQFTLCCKLLSVLHWT